MGDIRKIRKKIIKKYIVPLGKKYSEDISMDQIEKIFELAVSDFKREEISPDELSGICNYLWSMAYLKSMTDQSLSNFSNILLRGAEIPYYLRRADDSEKARIAVNSLADILNYANKSQN